jgi:hypothetical protein
MGDVGLAVLAVLGVMVVRVELAFWWDGVDAGLLALKALVLGVTPALALAVGELFLLAVLAGWLDQEMAPIEGGDCLARWAYESDEWRRFAEEDWRLSRREAGCLFLAVSVFAGVLLGVVFGLARGVVAALFGVAGGVAVAGFLSCGLLLYRWLRYQRNSHTDGEAYLTDDSVYLNGLFQTWGRRERRLQSVEWVDGCPAMLVLTIQCGSGRAQTEHTFRVPVPQGRRDEAEAVVRRWRRLWGL